MRSTKRRQAKELKKMLGNMSVSEIQKFITEIYVEGVNTTSSLHKEALKDIYGFGESRYSRIHEYVSDRLVKGSNGANVDITSKEEIEEQ